MNHADCEDFVLNCTDRRFTEIEKLYRTACRDLVCRLLIGSYTCGNYFAGLVRWLAQNPLPAGMAEYDLVIPVFSEKQLEWFPMAEAVLQAARHIVVNDYGMLRYFSGDKRVRLGRLLIRDYRDHRYPEYEKNSGYRAKASSLISTLREMGYEISAAESDLITPGYVLDVDQLDVYYHFPYRQISSAHICEFASIGRPVEKKFIPDDDCRFQCFDVKIRYGEEYVKIGRSIFDILPDTWLDTVPGLRIIYTPRW